MKGSRPNAKMLNTVQKIFASAFTFGPPPNSLELYLKGLVWDGMELGILEKDDKIRDLLGPFRAGGGVAILSFLSLKFYVCHESVILFLGNMTSFIKVFILPANLSKLSL